VPPQLEANVSFFSRSQVEIPVINIIVNTPILSQYVKDRDTGKKCAQLDFTSFKLLTKILIKDI
jgi:hypothetical protein